MARATILVHPQSDAPLTLFVDASDVGVGGVVQQLVNDTWQPLAFFSKRLQPAETKYSTFGRELLAAYLSVKHFRHMLEGRNFTLFTDHKPLTYALKSKPDRHSPREIRHLDFVSQFTSDIRHVSGKDNIPADALSRIHIDSLSLDDTVIDFDIIAHAQEEDEEIANLSDDDSLKLRRVPIPFSDKTILCDMSTDIARPYIPASFRNPFSTHFTTSPTAGLELPKSCALDASYGKASIVTYAHGLSHVFNVNDVRYIATQKHLLELFPRLMRDSTTSTSTSSDPPPFRRIHLSPYVY